MNTNRMGLEQSTLSNADLIAIASAAEEVISAIAGENEEVHPDNSTKMCALWDDLNDRHAPPAVVKAVVLELLARRNASKEPVAPFGYVHQCDHFFTNDHGNIYKTPGGNFTRPLYSAPPLQVVPAGWKLVPVEPTENMVIEGFESEPDSFFSHSDEWEAYKAMSGCQQAAHKARLCWAAMIAAAPKSVTNEP